MRISKTIIALLVVVTSFTACKKDKDEPQISSTDTIVGLWEGTYKSDATGNTFFYSLNFKAGGVVEEINSSGQKIGQGTYEIDNNIVTAHYNWEDDPSGFSIIAAFYPNTAKLLGDWGYGNSSTDGGTFEMHKKQN